MKLLKKTIGCAIILLQSFCTYSQTTFPSPGPQTCQSTNTVLPAITAADGVTIKPYLRLEASCLDTDLDTFSVRPLPPQLSATWNKPTFCYNNSYFRSTSGYPLAIARISTANGGNCNGGRSNVVADFTTSPTRPKGLSFTINDVDYSYDSIEVKVYSNGDLVPFTFELADPINSFVQTTNSGTVTIANFNGGRTGAWTEATGWHEYEVDSPVEEDPVWLDKDTEKGTIYFTVDPNVYVDSVVMTHIMIDNRNTINAAVSIGDFKWLDNATLPVVFGTISAAISGTTLQVHWQTLAEKNNDYFEIQVSEDGKNFKTIGTVKSKAANHNSDIPITYQFATTGNRYTFIGLGVIAFLGALLFGRRNKWIFGVLLLTLTIASVACTKNDQTIISNKKDVFVRIIQVDIDGTTAASKVIKATIQD